MKTPRIPQRGRGDDPPAAPLAGGLELGLVTKAHGIRGEVKFHLHSGDAEVLRRLAAVWLVLPGRPPRRYDLEAQRTAGGFPLIRLSGVNTRDDAEALRGAVVWALRQDLPALEPGEYYLHDLLGAVVSDPAGEIGEVVEIRCHPTVNALVIRTPSGKLLEQALGPAWVEDVDVDGGQIRLKSRDGLF